MTIEKTKPTRFTERVAFIFFVFLMTINLTAQSTANTFSVDIKHSRHSDPITSTLTHRERSYILDIGFHIDNQWAASASGTLIRSNTQQNTNTLTPAFITGLSGEYDFLSDDKSRLYLLLGMATGNYCECGDELPSVRSNLFYARYGIGSNIYLFNDIQLSIEFESNAILNRIPDAFSYNIISVGLRHNNWLQVGKNK